MEEKEERILIEVLGHRGCPVLNNNNICVLDYDCDDCKAGMTRKEAIEKMAKVICRTYGEDCETCRFNGNEKGCKRYLEFRNYIAMAEAALNALLEDK